jgi:hypothetical protein
MVCRRAPEMPFFYVFSVSSVVKRVLGQTDITYVTLHSAYVGGMIIGLILSRGDTPGHEH